MKHVYRPSLSSPTKVDAESNQALIARVRQRSEARAIQQAFEQDMNAIWGDMKRLFQDMPPITKRT